MAKKERVKRNLNYTWALNIEYTVYMMNNEQNDKVNLIIEQYCFQSRESERTPAWKRVNGKRIIINFYWFYFCLLNKRQIYFVCFVFSRLQKNSLNKMDTNILISICLFLDDCEIKCRHKYPFSIHTEILFTMNR